MTAAGRLRALAVAATAGLVVLLASPAAAFACPACAGTDTGGIGRIAALGAMILLPFGIVIVVVRAIRNATPPPIEHDESSGGRPWANPGDSQGTEKE